MSGEVFSQSSLRSKKKKERPVQVEEKPAENNASTALSETGKARIDTKDGATYLGDFIGESEEAYNIKIISDDTLSIAKSDIKRAKTPSNAIVLNQGKYHNTTGLFLHYSVGFNVGFNGGGFMADAGLGYRFTKNWELISGIGFMGTNVNVFEIQNSWGEYETFFPTYLGAKYNLTHKGARIFAATKVGYASSPLGGNLNGLIWGADELSVTGGAYFEPSIGLSFASKRIGQTSISISQIFQHSNFELNSVDRFNNLVTGSGNIWIRRLGIKLTTTVF